MEFLGPKRGLGMELEYGKFHVELYSHSGIQGGFPTLAVYMLSLRITGPMVGSIKVRTRSGTTLTVVVTSAPIVRALY